MDIFIRRLPDATTRLDLLRFVSSALKPKWYELQFAPIGKIKACEICQLNNDSNHLEEFHGLVRVEPANAALAVIERLNGEEINSKQVQVRKFFRRSTARDPRKSAQTTTPSAVVEQRTKDRRRPHLVLQSIHAGDASTQFEQMFETIGSPMPH